MLARVARDSLARNSVLIMASTVGTSGLGYLYWMVAARALPPSRIGTATALISAATVVSMVSNLGIGHMFIQRLPGRAAAAWSRTVTAGLLLGCAATATAALIAVAVLPHNFAFLTGPAGAVGLLATAVALTASTLLDYVFVAHRASQGMLWRNLALALGKLLTLLALTSAGLRTADAVILAWTAPSLLVTVHTLGSLLPRLRPAPSPAPAGGSAGARSWAAELGHIRAALTGHHLVNLAQAGPSALLPVLVTARLGAGQTAHFYVAWMTASVLFMVSPAVASALFAERSNDARSRSASLPRAALVVLVVIGGPAVLLFLCGGWILGLFSAGYAAGGTLLKILVLAAVPDAITNLAVAHWRSHGRLRLCLRLNLLMAATCLALTWLWLPSAGIAAAGLAWLTGQSAGALVVAALALHARLKPMLAVRGWAPLRRRGTGREVSRRRVALAARPLGRGGGRGRGRAPASRLGRPARPAFRSRPRSRSWRVP